MEPTKRMWRLGAVNRLVVTATALLLVVGLIAGVGAPASAATDLPTGRPGYTTIYQAQGSGVGEVITIPSPYAWRSPATSGVQTAWVKYSVTRTYDGRHFEYGWYQRTIPTGAQGVWLPTINADVTALTLGPGKVTGFVVAIEVHWHASTGTWLGTRQTVFNHSGDYVCTWGQISSGNNCLPGNPGLIFWT